MMICDEDAAEMFAVPAKQAASAASLKIRIFLSSR
jgi:hypothetical protein